MDVNVSSSPNPRANSFIGKCKKREKTLESQNLPALLRKRESSNLDHECKCISSEQDIEGIEK